MGKIVVDGIEYRSKSAAARALWEDENNNMTVSEIAKKLGVAAPTVHVATKSREKTKERQNRYKAEKLGKTGKYSVSMIAERCNMKQSIVATLMKEKGIKLPTKKELDSIAKRNSDSKSKKNENTSETNETNIVNKSENQETNVPVDEQIPEEATVV